MDIHSHWKTFIANLKNVPKFTYWKDLLYILAWFNIGEGAYEEKFVRNVRYRPAALTGSNHSEDVSLNKRHRRQQWRPFLNSLEGDEAKNEALKVRNERLKHLNDLRKKQAELSREIKAADQNRNTQLKQLNPFYKSIQG